MNVNQVDMRHKPLNIFALLLLALLLGLTGCKDIRDIRVTSVEVESLSPRGFKSVDVFLKVGVDNPAKQVKISEIDGSVKHSGKVIGNVAMAPVILAARTDSTYTVKADVSLADGVSVMDVLALAGQKSQIEAATVNIYAKAKVKGGPVRKFKIEHMPVKKLLELLKR